MEATKKRYCMQRITMLGLFVFAGILLAAVQCDRSSAQVPKTGQTTTYGTRDDGELQLGVTWPSPRFTDNGNGTVTDTLTGLIWLKNANCTAFFSGDGFGQNARPWSHALKAANLLSNAYCGLTDGSSAGDWRLPHARELSSLVDYSRFNPALPSGHPFDNVQSEYYWLSTTYAKTTWYARIIHLNIGNVFYGLKTYMGYYVWPVRGPEPEPEPSENYLLWTK